MFFGSIFFKKPEAGYTNTQERMADPHGCATEADRIIRREAGLHKKYEVQVLGAHERLRAFEKKVSKVENLVTQTHAHVKQQSDAKALEANEADFKRKAALNAHPSRQLAPARERLLLESGTGRNQQRLSTPEWIRSKHAEIPIPYQPNPTYKGAVVVDQIQAGAETDLGSPRDPKKSPTAGFALDCHVAEKWPPPEDPSEITGGLELKNTRS